MIDKLDHYSINYQYSKWEKKKLLKYLIIQSI